MHIAIIMDGNGRWAEQRGLPRSAGHRAGARAVRRIVEAAAQRDAAVLTLYAFSSDNWSRPPREVSNLMRLLQTYLRSEAVNCRNNGIRINVIGRRDRMQPSLLAMVEQAERITADGRGMLLRIAIDYSAREILRRAAAAASDTDGDFEGSIARSMNAVGGVVDVDLLIRPGGERRLSDFLLYECAYAELHFVDTFWPDFTASDLDAALRIYAGRQRRFGRVAGGLPRSAAGGTGSITTVQP